jgi:hypothetical protein
VDGFVISERARQGWTEALEDHPFLSIADLESAVEAGRAQWWEGVHSDVFTFLHGGVLEGGPVAGDPDEIVNEMTPRIEAWAAAAGAKEVLIQAGRVGWARLFAPHGYEVAGVILRKKL